jgi:hypothetical protein
MNKLLSAASAIAIVIAGSAAQAGVVLSDENLDNVTAGATFAINTNTDFPVVFTIPGMTLVGQCAGNEWTINVNEVICSSCALAINQSGITVTDASGHILYRGPAGMLALPQNSPVMVVGQNRVKVLAP